MRHHDDEEPDRVRRLTSGSDLAGVAAAGWSVFWVDQVGLDQAAIDKTPDAKTNDRLKPQQANQREAEERYAYAAYPGVRENRDDQCHGKRERPGEPLLSCSDPLWRLVSHEKCSQSSDRTERCEPRDLAQCEVGGNDN